VLALLVYFGECDQRHLGACEDHTWSRVWDCFII